MSIGVWLEELLAWNEESATVWKGILEDNPAILELPCDIGGVANVQQFVRHIWGAELRWAQRLAGVPETARDTVPHGPLDALYDLHLQAVQLFAGLLADQSQNWEATYTLDVSWLPPHARTSSRRKILAHALFHSQRHWAQLATQVRVAGFPSGFKGDLLFSSTLR
jgi:uncharacterized damage-inducible protein DinB